MGDSLAGPQGLHMCNCPFLASLPWRTSLAGCVELFSDLFIFDITWVKWADKRKIKIFKHKGSAIMAPFTGL